MRGDPDGLTRRIMRGNAVVSALQKEDIMSLRLTVAVAMAFIMGVALPLLTVDPALADPSGRKLSTTLTGAAEVPGPGDPDGSGTAQVTVNVGQRSVCYTVTVANIAAPTAAHIHEAPAGQAGPVVVPLAAPTDGSSSGCATVDRELAKEILKRPSDYYVNVHNADFPAGAVRGQLSK
jgi:hypothetical protein